MSMIAHHECKENSTTGLCVNEAGIHTGIPDRELERNGPHAGCRMPNPSHM